MAKAQTATKVKRREKKNIASGVAYINSTYNNTMITITDEQGNVIAWSSAGANGFKGSRASTPYAAQIASEKAARGAQDHGLKYVRIFVKGPGSGRESAIRGIQSTGIVVNHITECTPIPHNGVKKPGKRRI